MAVSVSTSSRSTSSRTASTLVDDRHHEEVLAEAFIQCGAVAFVADVIEAAAPMRRELADEARVETDVFVAAFDVAVLPGFLEGIQAERPQRRQTIGGTDH